MTTTPPPGSVPGRSVVTVAVVHPNVLVSSGIRRILEFQSGFRVVAESADMRRAVTIAAEHRPRVLVMSAHSPDVIPTAHVLRKSFPATSIALVVDDALDTDAATRALAAGVSAVLDPPRQSDALIGALRLVADGRAVIMPAALRDALIARAGEVSEFDRESVTLVDRLSAREYEVLGHLACGLTNAKIAAAMSVSEHTVKSHIKRVLQKLRCDSRGAAALIAFRSGVVR